MLSRTRLILSLLKRGCDPAQILVSLAQRAALSGCDSALDIGCGPTLTLRQLGLPHIAGIEGFEPSYQEAKRRNSHDRLVLGDIRQLDGYFHAGEFDACIALDVIEHLSKEDGLKLMVNMEKIARKRVIFFTPSGFLPQGHSDSKDLQVHLSGWEPSEMERLGYRVIGLLGPKGLRGEYHALKGRPRTFWALVSLLGHFLWTRWHPEKAAAILCIKDLPAK